MRTLPLTATILALLYAPASAAGSGNAQPGLSSIGPATDFSAAKRRKRAPVVEAVSRYRHGPGTIACTHAGCQTVPPGCHAIRERTVDDSPSGFQIIVC
jgi:hypothetical protein